MVVKTKKIRKVIRGKASPTGDSKDALNFVNNYIKPHIRNCSTCTTPAVANDLKTIIDAIKDGKGRPSVMATWRWLREKHPNWQTGESSFRRCILQHFGGWPDPK